VNARRRNEAGVVLPTRLVVASISLVAIGGLFFMATQPEEPPTEASPVATTPPPSASPQPTAPAPKLKPKPKPKPQVKRGEVYVEVYNNSNISGLAGSTAGQAQSIGWNVVGSDNWYGTIDSTTVYYPAKLERAAKLLAKDLGIQRLRPAIDPMRLDRLTVILTGDAG
jgi:hypothetical protein